MSDWVGMADAVELVPGLTYRNVHYWAEKGFIALKYERAGSGRPNGVAREDLDVLRRVVRLRAVGIPIPMAFLVARSAPEPVPVAVGVKVGISID